MLRPTQFTHPIAVETWDAVFRWRAGRELRDVTVDDTWWRVAEAVTAQCGSQASLWAHRYVDAFSQWRLLPDERLLRCAGTDERPDIRTPPAAVLNVAAFVSAPFGIAPSFKKTLFEETAAMAVRLLDDAVQASGGTHDAGLRIGVIGFGDALRRLGVSYLSDEAWTHAETIARALAEGCLRGACDLAEERGLAHGSEESTAIAAQWRQRGVSESLIARIQRVGVRHTSLTAIQSHPLLARLANGASDGIDPLPLVGGGADAIFEVAREGIRAAMRPWIDVPLEEVPLDEGAVATATAGPLKASLDRQPV